jgi:regulator of sirC expression with transglutaminase-like and TPR domain
MARAAQRGRKRAKPSARRRRRAAASPVSQQPDLFFDRLRRRVKWVYIFLVVVFGLGFVFLGVGSGSTGIGDLLQGNFSGIFGSGSSSSSVSNAQDYVTKHPNDPKGYRRLAKAYETNQQGDKAVAPLERLIRLRPKDRDALQHLAALYSQQGQRYQAEVSAAQLEAQGTLGASTFAPQPSGKLGKALGQNQIFDAVNQTVQTRTAGAQSRMQAAFGNQIRVTKQLAALPPPDPNAVFSLVLAAEAAGDTQTELAALKRFVKLAPQDPNIGAVKKRIKVLEKTKGATIGQ